MKDEKKEKKLLAEIRKLEKEIWKLKYTKVKGRGETTIKGLELQKKERDEKDLLGALKTYKNRRGNGGNMEKIAAGIGIGRKSFSKKFKYFEEKKVLPEHGNKNRTPWNKTPDSIVEKVMNETKEFLELVDKQIENDIPVVATILFKFIQLRFEDKGEKLDISISTFIRYLKKSDIVINLKYGMKLRKRLDEKAGKLCDQLKNVKEESIALHEAMEEEAIQRQIFAEKPIMNRKMKRAVSKNRNAEKPGITIQWDGSMDWFYGGKKVTRMQVIDNSTLQTLAVYFVWFENNKGFQMLLSQVIDKFGIPKRILGDRRKGVDPRDEGALHAIVAKFLGITLDLDSESTHKSELESLNGKMHNIVSYYTVYKGIKTIDELNGYSEKIIELTNEHMEKKESDYSHLEQATDEIKEILRGDITQMECKASEGIVYQKKYYQAFDGDNCVELDKHTWVIISLRKNIPVKIWCDKGVFPLRKVEGKVKLAIKNKNQMRDAIKNHFIDNKVIIMNRETSEAVYNSAYEEGKRDAINYRLAKLDEQVIERTLHLQRLSKKIAKEKESIR